MQPSPQLIEFIKKQEGFSPEAYKPLPTDRWTMGYGSTFVDGVAVQEGDSIDEEEANNLLTQSVNTLADKLNPVPENVTQQEFDAVVSLAYNIGLSSFKHSDTGSLFYSGENIADKFPIWNRSGGRVIQGLVNRREQERAMYENGDYA